jgi:ribonuclease HI
MAKQAKWYVVWKGNKTGIFTSWADCQVAIKGYAGALFKSFESKAEAEAAFKGGHAKQNSSAGSGTGSKPSSAKRSPRLPNALSVDAACSGNPGKMEYQGVWVDTKEPAFLVGPFPMGTNNIGEFLGLVHALAMLDKQNRHDVPIYTDSITGIAWVRNRNAKTNLVRNAKTEPLWVLIDRALFWLENNQIKNPIYKWETDIWGEIPADFGRK